MRRIFDFWRDQRGNTAILFGLAIIPLLALGGGAVDFSQRARIGGEMQSAADTAALAAARHIQNGTIRREADWETLRTQAQAIAHNLLAAALENLSEDTPDINIDITEEAITVQGTYDVPTSFLGVIGIDTLPAHALAAVNLPASVIVEVALVLDYSGSMLDNDKYIRMRDAAIAFIQKVEEERADRTKIGIVPFSKYVYASVPAALVRDTPPEQAMTNMSACLGNRGYPYSTTNEPPYSTIAESRWPEAPTECDAYATNGLMVRDLTDNFSGLVSAIAAMQPVNLTNISLGTELGWHLLSPNAPFETARNYSDGALRKILIVLTDGVQTVDAEGPSGSTSVADANETTAELCTNIKATGIRVFTIAYDVDDTAVYTLLSGCASGPAEYHEVHDASDISGVFETIYAQIAESAWLSR